MSFVTNIGKLVLETPIVCASGTFGFGYELRKLVDFETIGAFVTKTITLHPQAGNPPPRIIELDCGVLNSIGLQNPGLEVFIRDILPQLRGLNSKCIVSVGGEDLDEYVEVVKRLNSVKTIRAFEINLSCPNLKLKRMISQTPKVTYKIVKILRELTEKVLIVKVTGEVEDIVKIAKVVKEAGADGISLVNTFLGMGIDVRTRRPYLGHVCGGYSGKGIKPLSLYRVWKVAKKVDIPIIGGGGIMSAYDAIEFFLAGAQVISIGTANLVDPCFAKSLMKDIVQYMQENKIDDIKDLRGRLIE